MAGCKTLNTMYPSLAEAVANGAGHRVRVLNGKEIYDLNWYVGHQRKIGDFETIERVNYDGQISITGSQLLWDSRWLEVIEKPVKPNQYINGGPPVVGDKVCVGGYVLEVEGVSDGCETLNIGLEYEHAVSLDGTCGRFFTAPTSECFRVKSADGLFVSTDGLGDLL